MTAYLIVYGEHPGDRFAAYAYPSRAMARAASLPSAGLVPSIGARPNAGGCAYVIEKPEDITFSGRLLVEVYNALTCKNVTRFNDRAKGVHLLMQALEALDTEKHMITVDEPTRADTVPLSEPPK